MRKSKRVECFKVGYITSLGKRVVLYQCLSFEGAWEYREKLVEKNGYKPDRDYFIDSHCNSNPSKPLWP